MLHTVHYMPTGTSLVGRQRYSIILVLQLKFDDLVITITNSV